MASHGHHENGLSDEPVENQAAAEDETGNDSDGVLTAHQEKTNNQEIDQRFSESESLEEDFSFSTTATWHQRVAWAEGLMESCEDLSLHGKEEILQELNKISSCSQAECKNELCILRWELRTLIEKFYALSSSSATGVDVGPQVEIGPQLEIGPQDSAEIIALKKIIAASQAREAALRAERAALQAAWQVRNAASHMTLKAMNISRKHDHIKSVLDGVSRGRIETYFTIGTFRSKQQKLAATGVSLDAARFESMQAPSLDVVDELLQNCADLKVECQSPNDLSDFVAFLQNLLKKSQVPSDNYKSKKYSRHMQERVAAIVDWGTDTDGSVPTLFKPNWKGHETRGAHPTLCAIMWKIGYICNSDKRFFCEQVVSREGTRSPRFVDVVIADVIELVKATIPALLDVPLEIKPTAREEVSLDKRLVQGENQIIGYLAKILMETFHLGGIGADRVVRGVVMTTVSVEIIEMKLSGMGTAKVKVELKKTGHEPLFDMDTMLSLLGNIKEESRVIKKCLKQVKEGDSPQEGFILLQELLSGLLEHREPTSSTYSNKTGDISIQLGSLLGSGAFSTVYALKEHDETFLKTPKSRRCVKAMKNEAKVLKALDHTFIPKVFLEDGPLHLGILTVQLLCDKSELPSLRLKGLIGTPASKVNVENLNKGDLQCIVNDVMSALKHTHDRGWVHLDVRPSNIIIGQSGDGRPRVQLIDFGCAAQKNVVLSQFRGCPPFAHYDLLCYGLETWLPDDKHDMASLSFTIASLLAGNSVPWFGFDGCNIEPDILIKRSNIASKLLRENRDKLNVTTRKLLIESIGGSLVGPQKRRRKRKRQK
jgi:hypothetical protein